MPCVDVQGGEELVQATQGGTQSMSMTLGMPGDLGGLGGDKSGSPGKQGGGLSDAFAPSVTVYRRPFRWACAFWQTSVDTDTCPCHSSC